MTANPTASCDPTGAALPRPVRAQRFHRRPRLALQGFDSGTEVDVNVPLCLKQNEPRQAVGDAHAEDLAELDLRVLAVDLVTEDGLEGVVAGLGVVAPVRLGGEALGVEAASIMCALRYFFPW